MNQWCNQNAEVGSLEIVYTPPTKMDSADRMYNIYIIYTHMHVCVHVCNNSNQRKRGYQAENCGGGCENCLSMVDGRGWSKEREG